MAYLISIFCLHKAWNGLRVSTLPFCFLSPQIPYTIIINSEIGLKDEMIQEDIKTFIGKCVKYLKIPEEEPDIRILLLNAATWASVLYVPPYALIMALFTGFTDI